MNAIKIYNGLSGAVMTREDVKDLAIKAENEGCPGITEKLVDVLLSNNETETFDITVNEQIGTPGLNAPRHTGIAREALDDCGRLKPGYIYEKGGKISKVVKKKTNTKKTPAKPAATKKTKLEDTPKAKKVSTPKKAPIKKVILEKENYVNKEFEKKDADLTDFKTKLTLATDYAAALENDPVIPFRSATILWHEGKQLYEEKTAFSFTELRQYLIEIFKINKEDKQVFEGYTKCKVNFEFAEDIEIQVRMDLAVNDYNPLIEAPETFLMRYAFHSVNEYIIGETINPIFNLVDKESKNINNLALLQYGDDYDRFDLYSFVSEATVFLLNENDIKEPRIFIAGSSHVNLTENIEQWADIVKEYANEIGRVDAVIYFFNNAEFSAPLKQEIAYKYNFNNLPVKSNIPVHIETKSFNIEQTTEKFKKADSRKTTHLLKKYFKEVLNIKSSIKSDQFSMGSSITVNYKLGPATSYVDAVINRLEWGNFNSMEDIYESKSAALRGLYLDGYELQEFKYTSSVREVPREFMVRVAVLMDKNINASFIPKLEDIPGSTTDEKLSRDADFKGSPFHSYYNLVRHVLSTASFQTEDHTEIEDLKYHDDLDDQGQRYLGIYFTYKLKGKTYDTREFIEGTTKLDTPPKTVVNNIQIVNFDNKNIIVVGFLKDIKKQLISLGGEYKSNVNIKGFGEKLEGVILHKSNLEDVTNIILDYRNTPGLNGPSLNSYSKEIRSMQTFRSVIGLGYSVSDCSKAGKDLRTKATKKAGRILSACKNTPGKKNKVTPKKKRVTDNDVKKLKLSDIKTDTKRFQNRKKLNQNTVDQIVSNFNATKFDPLIVWLDNQDKKTYLLAGHHRLEALKQLGKKTASVKFLEATEKEAIKYAKFESNANRTLETPLERSFIYRELRNTGESEKNITDQAKIEGKNKNYILNLSVLNKNGIVLETLERLQETKDKQNSNEVEKLADWIGEARRKYDVLTDAHENEMFKFLQDKNASKRITNKQTWLQKIYSLAGTLTFDPAEPLNLKRFKYESEGEKVYNTEYSDLKDQITDKLKSISNINERFTDVNAANYIDPGKPGYEKIQANANKQIGKLNAEIKVLQQKLITLQKSKSKYTASKNEQVALFGAKTKKALGQVAPSKIKKIGAATNDQDTEFFNVPGDVGKFLQRVERKKNESVVITMDGQQGAGKTTTLYKFMNSFAKGGSKSLFASLEEHPTSALARDKVRKYIDQDAQENIDIIADFEDQEEFYSLIEPYEVVFIDSWQKLLRMIGNIRLDEDLRKRFDGKVFVVIFQQTTTGRTKGGAEVVFDGDIIIKMVKEASFNENYAYFDKNRYTLEPLENLRYNIATGKVYNPNSTQEENAIDNFMTAGDLGKPKEKRILSIRSLN